MDQNSKRYNAALHLFHAGVLLTEIEEELKTELLNHAEGLLDKIEIDKEEIEEIEKYKELIKT